MESDAILCTEKFNIITKVFYQGVLFISKLT